MMLWSMMLRLNGKLSKGFVTIGIDARQKWAS
jgi:hypothetical protein